MMSAKTQDHCSFPGCRKPRVRYRQRCKEHHALYLREQSRLKAAMLEAGPGTIVALDTNGDVLVMNCTVVQRVPAKQFRSGPKALKSFFDFLRWRGFQLVQMVTPDEAAAMVDEARAEKVEVA